MNGLFGQTDADDTQTSSLLRAYVDTGITLDDLPYTDAFEKLYESIGGERAWKSRWDVLHTLQNMRKAGKLPKLGRTGTGGAIRVTEAEEQMLQSLVVASVGSLGQRDQLLYAPTFDQLVHTFNAQSGRNLSAHDLWRLVAKLAK